MSQLLEILNFGNVPFRSDHENFEIFPEGETIYAIDKKKFKHVKDVTSDLYSPWTGMACDGNGNIVHYKCHSKKMRVLKIDGLYSLDDNGQFWFKIFDHRHPKTTSLHRKIFFVHTDETPSDLESHVFFIYSTNIPVIPHITLRKRKNFSTQVEIKEALRNRTKPEAKAFLRDNGIKITNYELASACRNVKSHKKLKIGRKPATNITKLHDRFACSSNPLERIEPLQMEKVGEKIAIVQIVTYPVAIKHLVATLPNFRMLSEHKKTIDLLSDLPEVESDDHIRVFLSQVNKSGSLPILGSAIFIDTTFGICSGENVTIAVGVSDQFRSKASDKMGSVILGIMIHTLKIADAHEQFSKVLNERLYEASPIKRVPSIIHDGESSFRVYNSGKILKDATPLRCQVHRAKNLKPFFSSTEDFDLFKKKVFGETVEMPTGSILKAGALNTLNFETYQERMNNIIDSCHISDLKNWLNRNLYDLFEYDSLYSRLKAGWLVHWLSTNIIEGRNAHIKTVVQAPLAAHSLLTVFLSLHEEEIVARLDAVRGRPSNLTTSHMITNYDSLTQEEKKSELSFFGLDDYIVEDEFGDYPQWVQNGDGCSSSSVYLDIVSKLIVHGSNKTENVYFIECSDQQLFSKGQGISKLIKNDAELFCMHPSCRKHRDYSYFFCVHMLAVFKNLDANEKTECFAYIDHRRNERTFVNMRFRTQKVQDGSKHTRRIGKQISQGNHSRAIHGIRRSSLETILDGSYIEEEEDLYHVED